MMTRRYALIVAVALGAFGLTAAYAQADDKLVLVVNAANDVKAVDSATVKNFYLGNVGFWGNGQRVTAFQRNDDSNAGKRFFTTVLRMAPSRYRHHWSTQQLSGAGVEPETLSSAASVVSKVASRPGAVGYILESEKAGLDNDKVRMITLE